MSKLRTRLVTVVTTLRADIDAGDSRTCQAAIEDLSETFIELDDSDAPANYVVRLRAEQAGLRKSLLRVYHLQREEFLPSAYAMIVAFVTLIIALITVTNFDGLAESLVTVGFLSFFLLVRRSGAGVRGRETVVDDIEAQAEEVEDQLVEVEEESTDPTKSAEHAAARLAPDE